MQLAYLNSRFQSGLKSPLDDAILRHEDVDVSGFGKVDEIPFDFERRCVSVLACRNGEAPVLVIKGAFEDILRLSSGYEDGAEVRPLDDELRANLTARFDALGREGFRVLGIASKPRPRSCSSIAKSDESDLVFAGFAAFQDPPKESAREALRSLGRLGIAVKVVTGDNELVAEHVCRRAGPADRRRPDRRRRSRRWTTSCSTHASRRRRSSAG